MNIKRLLHQLRTSRDTPRSGHSHRCNTCSANTRDFWDLLPAEPIAALKRRDLPCPECVRRASRAALSR